MNTRKRAKKKAAPDYAERRRLLTPTLTKQSIGFIIGGSLFAISAAPGFGHWAGTQWVNMLCFVGAWFFTGSGVIQLIRSAPITTPVSYTPGTMVRAEWLAASTQSFGTLLFNVSTTAALTAHTVKSQEHFIWNPDAGGSVAFLVSGWFVLVAYKHTHRHYWNWNDADWWSGQINMIGCIAFGIAAVGAYILPSGSTLDNTMANWGTFIGGICFAVASFIVLPAWRNRGKDQTADYAPVIG